MVAEVAKLSLLEVGYLSITTQKVVDNIDPILKYILSYIATPSINNLYCPIL